MAPVSTSFYVNFRLTKLEKLKRYENANIPVKFVVLTFDILNFPAEIKEIKGIHFLPR